MDKFEKMLRETDFSQYTDLKERLAAQLFGEKKTERETEKKSSKVVQFPFKKLSDDDLFMVNAAQGIHPTEDPFKKKDPQE